MEIVTFKVIQQHHESTYGVHITIKEKLDDTSIPTNWNSTWQWWLFYSRLFRKSSLVHCVSCLLGCVGSELLYSVSKGSLFFSPQNSWKKSYFLFDAWNFKHYSLRAYNFYVVFHILESTAHALRFKHTICSFACAHNVVA